MDYIKQQLQRGISKEEIKNSLLANGWQERDINEVFLAISSPIQSPMPVVQNSGMPNFSVLLKTSLKIYGQYFPNFLYISVFLLLPSLLLLLSSYWDNFFLYLFVIILTLFFNVIISLALIYATKQLISGQTVLLKDSLNVAFKFVLPAILISIFSFLVLLGAGVPLLVPMIIVSLSIMFAYFCLVIENQKGLNALLRSRNLTKGYLSKIFSRMFFLGALIFILMFFINYFFILGGASPTLKNLISGVLNVLISPLFIIFSYQIFRFLTERRPLINFNLTEGRGRYKGLLVWGIIVAVLFLSVFFIYLRKDFELKLTEIMTQLRSGKSTELLKQSRDNYRILDLSALKSTFGIYLIDIENPEKDFVRICQPGKIYYSNQGTTAVDGSGWLPINFNKMEGGSPIYQLPQDPQNTPPFVYRFACDAQNLTYELNADLEADYYRSGTTSLVDKDGGGNDKVYEIGTDLRIIP